MALGIDTARAREILTLAAPIVIAMLTQTFINVVDTIFIGKLDPSISTPGQAALGYSLPLLWAIGGSLAAIGVGTQVMTARRMGEEDREAAGKVLLNSAIVAFASASIVSVFAWFLVPGMFGFLTNNEAVLDLGIPYAQLRILGVLSMVVTTGYKGFFDGMGSTRVHMYAAITMNLANIILNTLLIFGVEGYIEPGYVSGAGLASVLSTYVGFFMIIGWAALPSFKEFRIYRTANISPKVMWELVKLSAPSGMAQIFIMSGVLMFLKIIGLLDEYAVLDTLKTSTFYASDGYGALSALLETVRQAPEPANKLLLSDWGETLMWSRPPMFATAAKLIIDLLSIGFVTCIAFGTATATLVSRSMGSGEFKKAALYGWDSVKLGMYFYGALGLVIIVFPEFFLDLLSDDPLVIQAAVPGLQIMAGLEMFISMALVLTQALFGAGATKFVMIVEFVLHGLCLAPLAYLFSMVLGFGFLGVWISGTVYVFLLAAVMAWKFWNGSWAHITV